MRSKSFDTRRAPIISRKSTAIGWRRAMIRMARSSSSCCNASLLESSITTLCASAKSRLVSEALVSAICFSASPTMSATLRASCWRAEPKALMVCSGIVWLPSGSVSVGPVMAVSAEPPRDIVLGASIARRREKIAGLVEFHELAQIHEGGVVGHARGLLHVVGDNHDRIVVLELVDQLFDLRRGD